MKNIQRYIILLAFLLFAYNVKGQISEEQAKVSYLYNFGVNIEWPDEDTLTSFRIVLLGEDEELFKYMKLLSLSRKINDLPIKVYNETELDRVVDYKPQIVYVTEYFNYRLRDIYYFLLGKHILLVTENTPSYIYTMINLYSVEEDGKLRILFKINRQNIEAEDMQIKDKLLVYGGSEVDLKEIIKEKELELQRDRKLVEEQKKKMAELQRRIDSQMTIIARQEEDIASRKAQIKQMRDELEMRKRELDKARADYVLLVEDINNKQRTLNEKMRKIEDLEFKLDSQKTAIVDKIKVLQKLKSDIDYNKQVINKQKKELANIQQKFDLQRRYLYYLIVFITILFIFSLVIIRNYRVIKKYSQALQEKNFEVEAQAEQLLRINKELEKLSIVASKTDNVILLVRPDGIVEWCNHALERHYGYSFDEVVGKYFGEVAASAEARKYLNLCTEKKEPVVYENLYSTKDGNLLYIQTTLTPILDERENIKWIVVIDTDITDLKKAQAQIEKRNRLLLLQRDELLKQKQKIEQQSLIIRSSVEYAQRIQQSILPSETEIMQYVKESFVLFLPKDIVSGDFYWLGKSPKYPQYKFLAVVDCTGHGVPGAFMALISSRLLVEIIEQQNVVEPQEILYKLDEQVHNILKHKVEDVDSTPDGFDIALFRFEQKDNGKHELVFAGAKRPLVYFEPMSEDMFYYKGTRRSIGGIWSGLTVSEFEQIVVEVSEGTIFYAYTDGFIDQGNDTKKRYGTPRFHEFLKMIRMETMDKQKQLLYDEFTRWKRKTEQRDDITVWGFKI